VDAPNQANMKICSNQVCDLGPWVIDRHCAWLLGWYCST
jgi:hypothetical protein